MVWFEIIPELCALAIFHSALYINHRRDPEKTFDYLDRRVQVLLMIAYSSYLFTQIESNKRVIHIILPVLWTHFIFNAFTSFALQLYPLVSHKDQRSFENNIFSSTLILPLYLYRSPWNAATSFNCILQPLL